MSPPPPTGTNTRSRCSICSNKLQPDPAVPRDDLLVGERVNEGFGLALPAAWSPSTPSGPGRGTSTGRRPPPPNAVHLRPRGAVSSINTRQRVQAYARRRPRPGQHFRAYRQKARLQPLGGQGQRRGEEPAHLEATRWLQAFELQQRPSPNRQPVFGPRTARLVHSCCDLVQCQHGALLESTRRLGVPWSRLRHTGSQVMKPPPFVYHRPNTLDEALDVLGEYGDEAKVLAGGQSLMPLLSLRLAHPAHLVDINRIDGQLSQVAPQDGGLRVGALVRQRAAEASGGGPRRLPLAGGCAAADRPYADSQPRHSLREPGARRSVLRAARGCTGAGRPRWWPRAAPVACVGIAADAFFRGYLTTALEPDELLTELRLPAVAGRHGMVVPGGRPPGRRFCPGGCRRRAATRAAGICQDVRLTAIGARPARSAGEPRGRTARAAVLGGGVTAAAQALGKEVDPASDVQATAAYRRYVTVVLARRALDEAAARARTSASSAGES